MALLSGGIDSPVAINLMQNRLEVIAVHFHQVPLTGEEELDKVKELVKILGLKKVYLIPFAKILKELTVKCDHRDYFILSKILMFKTAELIAEKEKAKYLITGENLGQVASQTLDNLTLVTKAVEIPILRPLLGNDKQETVDLAKEIGTYDVSIEPGTCCKAVPRQPITKGKEEKLEKEEKRIDIGKLVDEGVRTAEVVIL